MSSTQPSASISHSATATRLDGDHGGFEEGSEKRTSSLDEKRSIDSSSSQSADGLLHEARTLEAQHKPKPDDAHEHQVPRRTKIIFVTIYFFLNLTLTLSNKSVLSKVSATMELSVIIKTSLTSHLAKSPMALNNVSHDCDLNRQFHPHGHRPPCAHTS